MLSQTPTLPSILLGIFLFSREAHELIQLLDTLWLMEGQKVQKDLQCFSGPEGAFLGTEGQDYDLAIQQQQILGAIGSTALHKQVWCAPAMTMTNY